jgi:hypothetical protein
MFKPITFFILLSFIFSCVEPYEFVVKDEQRTLVIEAYISDKSFDESLEYPSNGRYFSTKLTYSGDVTNVRPEMVRGALVTLSSSAGETWEYTEVEPGIYQLLSNTFRAVDNTSYKLMVSSNESVFESTWETLPSVEPPGMGDINFKETEKQAYVVESNKNVLRTKKGITTNVTVPVNNTNSSVFYRWEFTPMWIYKAPLSSVVDPGHKCWATDPNYLHDYVLQVDNVGGYTKDLFFIETIRNERLFEDFSLLLTQQAMSERYYNFWKEMQDQVLGGALINSPPFNLQTNYRSVDDSKKVLGYFGVVREQARRWYFNIKDLSYTVVNTLRSDCLVDYGPGGPAPECENCLEYSFGKTTVVEPSWWRR